MTAKLTEKDINLSALIKIAIQGMPAPPLRFGVFDVDCDGRAHALPSVGGITYNIKVGDPAFGLAGEHVEPGVSTLMDRKDRKGRESQAYQFLACAGNEAVIVSGAAKGSKGVVVGHHGGVEHLMLDFSDSVMNKMTYNDIIIIRSVGQGLVIKDSGDVKVCNLDPGTLIKWGWKREGGHFKVPVSAVIPSSIMGSGLGQADPYTGDYDITTQDKVTVKKLGIEKLRLGDFVAIQDADNTYGRHFMKGALTIGVVIHSDSVISGHGPGVMTLASSKTGLLKPVVSKSANIGAVLKIGRFRSRK